MSRICVTPFFVLFMYSRLPKNYLFLRRKTGTSISSSVNLLNDDGVCAVLLFVFDEAPLGAAVAVPVDAVFLDAEPLPNLLKKLSNALSSLLPDGGLPLNPVAITVI